MTEIRPCQDCGMELPARVLDAAELLYQGGQISGEKLAEQIVSGIQGRADHDAWRATVGIKPSTDAELVASAIRALISPSYEHLLGAVRHYGSLTGTEDSECERTAQALWCHARDEMLARGSTDEWARSLCNLDGGHEGRHSFEPAPAEQDEEWGLDTAAQTLERGPR